MRFMARKSCMRRKCCFLLCINFLFGNVAIAFADPRMITFLQNDQSKSVLAQNKNDQQFSLPLKTTGKEVKKKESKAEKIQFLPQLKTNSNTEFSLTQFDILSTPEPIGALAFAIGGLFFAWARFRKRTPHLPQTFHIYQNEK
jgi:hypothetical protein